MTILKAVYELTEEALKRKHELEQKWASQEEISLVVSECLFKVDVLINWVPYHLMQQ